MLVVKVELWPGGDGRHKQELARLEIVNVSGLAPVSDYAVTMSELVDGKRRRYDSTVSLHRRAEGKWGLIIRAIKSALIKRDEVTDDAVLR